ncbi:MAG: hypothetical protein GY737_29695 [Desulfobacteraceae bacterium]|nr:hypothetical protein [Desulfobacteraceae bacterium]
MYYIYFPYALVVSSLFLIFALRKKTPVWWALVVLLAPVTAPYFFFKASRSFRGVFTTFFCLSFLLVGAGEGYIYYQDRIDFKYSNFSPVGRQLVQLTKKLKKSTHSLDKAIEHLEVLSKVESTRTGIGETINYIGTVQMRRIENLGDIERFLAFTRDYRSVLEKEGADTLLALEAYYSDPMVVGHLESLKDYLPAFEELLRYTFDNFRDIELKSSKHRENYDVYYLKYRRKVDRHNRLCGKRIQFRDSMVRDQPELDYYLPVIHQTDYLRMWQ